MASIRLNAQLTNKLIGIPESGMGYHVVDVVLKNGSVIEELTVLNCQNLIVDEKNIAAKDVIDVKVS